MVRYDPAAVVTFDVLRKELAQQAAQQAEAVAKLMDKKIQLAQNTTMKQQATIKKFEKIKMLTQEYQALETTLHRKHPGDDNDVVRRSMEQVERQYNTLVTQFQRNHTDTTVSSCIQTPNITECPKPRKKGHPKQGGFGCK